ncbi:MAG: type II toxin-antitoxin system YoeB family toxin [Rhodobacter sp.]|nr:type II toxin-antitoxin system YoeB family toxin [Rhodobacter sp.]
MLGKGNTSVKECQRHRFKGTGQPGPLQGGLSGFRSRRTCREHRLVSVVRRDAGKGKPRIEAKALCRLQRRGRSPRLCRLPDQRGHPCRQRCSSFA